jgi:hypothetical protein
MPAISLLSGLAFILLFTMICTAPSWIAGRISARKNTDKNWRLTTPGRGHALIRWTLLLITGFATLSLFSTMTAFNTGAAADGNYIPAAMGAIATAGFAAASQYLAFAIGYTTATTRIAMRNHAALMNEAPQDQEHEEVSRDSWAAPTSPSPATSSIPADPIFIAPKPATQPKPPRGPGGEPIIELGLPGFR